MGKFQDGGLTHNNPLRLALKEIKALFPNDPSAKRSTLKVSLGTGRIAHQEFELDGSGSWWRDLWFFRLVRALWFSIDGEENSDNIHRREIRAQMEEKKTGRKKRWGEFFRFNVDFLGRQPRLDEAEKMAEMSRITLNSMRQSTDLVRLSECLRAQYFVFELEDVPKRENGRYSCIGFIRCTHRARSLALDVLLEQLTRSSARFLLQERPLPGSFHGRSSLAGDGTFEKQVCFEVVNRQEAISFQLWEQGSEVHNINGSPYSIDWLIQAQESERAFGGPRGLKRKRKDDVGGPRRRQRP